MFAIALGLAQQNAQGTPLAVYYPQPILAPSAALLAGLRAAKLEAAGVHWLSPLDLERLRRNWLDAGEATQAALAGTLLKAQGPVLLTCLGEDGPLEQTAEAYLKLHLLSHRLCLPNSLNLDGIFAVLPTVAWTSEGAIALEALEARQLEARLLGRPLKVHAVDKFPTMTDFVVPAGVRIGDGGRIRLGAYLGEGTTVMHEGFVNFNAGTLGSGMIEGRISQGVVVGKGSDLGGSASTAGTLSGGGTTRISIGEACLISANAGTGIPLGDRCTIEAGLYITPGTRVTLRDEQGAVVRVCKARELAGGSDMLFLRHSETGAVECRSNRQAIALNPMLHQGA
jgi:2,3,4,5-tetrahydropyridine-2,6-dicarboxylate N-succinyltransferase